MRPRAGRPLALCVLVLVSLAAGGGAGAGSPAALLIADSVTTAEYDVAGVRVIHRIAATSDLVAVRLHLLGGTRQLTRATEGIEALLLEAAQSETQRAMALTGAQSFVDAGPDWTATGFVALRRDFAAAWPVFAGWFDGVPGDTAVRLAKNLLVSAARRRSSHPDLRIQTIARLTAFRGHPYALDPEGTERSLPALSARHFEPYVREQFVRSRLLLVVVGNVSRAEVEPLVESTLGRLPAGAYTWTLPPPVPFREMSWLTEHRPLPTNYILGYFMGPEPTHSDYYPFQVATQLLSSRLFHAIRTRRALSYAAYAPVLDYAIPIGGIYASSTVPSQVYEVMLAQVTELASDALPPRVLRDFLDQFTLDRLAEQMTHEVQAERLGRAALLFGDFRVADDGWKKLRQVRPRDILRAAEKYMRNPQLAYLGDTTLMSGRW